MIFYHEQHYFRLKYNEHIDIGAKNLLQTIGKPIYADVFQSKISKDPNEDRQN
jgi:hypothetical protein